MAKPGNTPNALQIAASRCRLLGRFGAIRADPLAVSAVKATLHAQLTHPDGGVARRAPASNAGPYAYRCFNPRFLIMAPLFIGLSKLHETFTSTATTVVVAEKKATSEGNAIAAHSWKDAHWRAPQRFPDGERDGLAP